MNVRVISGKYGGRTIGAPERRTTHPMGERIRNALFNSIGAQVQDARVLDAFAGSGAIGLEALSRGAKHVTFIEKDRVASSILLANITALRCETDTTVIRTTVSNWLETSGETGFDLIFADPPYHDTQFSTVKKLFPLLNPGALMVLSHPGRGEAPTELGVVVVDNRSYGTAALTFYRRDE